MSTTFLPLFSHFLAWPLLGHSSASSIWVNDSSWSWVKANDGISMNLYPIGCYSSLSCSSAFSFKSLRRSSASSCASLERLSAWSAASCAAWIFSLISSWVSWRACSVSLESYLWTLVYFWLILLDSYVFTRFSFSFLSSTFFCWTALKAASSVFHSASACAFVAVIFSS